VAVDRAVNVTVREDVQASDDVSRFEAEAIPYMRQMFPAAFRLTRDRCDAEDLIQETFARAYLKFHQFTPGTNLRAWLHRIMFHTFYSTCRKRKSRPAETLTGDLYDAIDSPAERMASHRSAEEEAIDNLAGSRVMRALAELPDSFKTVLYLADVQGYRYSEIAEIMGTPIGTVMSRIHRARHLLRTRLLGQIQPQGQPAATPSLPGPDAEGRAGSIARTVAAVGSAIPRPASDTPGVKEPLAA
jgi:RNA polymerase sigma-70 factor, ECF subfamily